jgi:hypothetical protein
MVNGEEMVSFVGVAAGAVDVASEVVSDIDKLFLRRRDHAFLRSARR